MPDNKSNVKRQNRRPQRPSPMAPVEKPKDFKGTVKKLARYLGIYKAALILVFVFAIGSTVFNTIGPKVLSLATTSLFEGLVAKVQGTGGIDFDYIAGVLVTTLVLYLVSSACSSLQGWLMAGVTQKTCYKLRNDISVKIDRMPFGYFERNSTGDTLSRITNDVDTLGQSLNQGLTQAVTSVTTIIGVFIMMLTINTWMTLVTVLIVPLSALFMALIVKRSQKYFNEQQERLGTINGIVEETFSGHSLVRAYNREDDTVARFKEENEKLYKVGWKAQFVSGVMKPLMDFVGNLGYVAVAVLGSYFAATGIITVGDIQAFIQYVKNFTQPITQLAQVSNMLQQLAAAAERIFEFLGEDEAEAPTTEAQAKPQLDGTVEFEHVSFGYTADKIIIKDFSASIEEGMMVALVGPTGAGKTTLVKLLMRFYDPQEGVIRIGGVDSRTLEKQQVRQMFSMVLQDAWLFNGTIRDNIRYGRLDATDEEIEQAAVASCADHFIQTLPGGYDFVITEDGDNISQGQRQLITIARAMLANRQMLILDEATSSVDTLTEERIQNAMANLMKGRTSFVIAHRLSTIKDADTILVVRDGDIVEQGNHKELLSLGGFYAELYNSQFVDCDDVAIG